MSLVIEVQCFPCINYMKKLIIAKHVKIEQYESFQKMSFRNRFVISGSNGIQNLTIPVVGGREQKSPIKEVRIDYSTDWKSKHWKSLLSVYSKAPFFEFYGFSVKEILFSGEEFLFQLNIKILEWICKELRISLLMSFTEEFCSSYSNDDDFRNRLIPRSFQSDTQNWQPRYPQLFEDRIGFQPNLSIIDLLFSEGPNAINLLRNFSNGL